MTRAAKIFEQETAALGGRFPRDQAPAPVKAGYDEVAERAEDLIDSARRAVAGLPPIHFDFIWNGDINAIAFRSGDRYFIGVTTGLLFMLRLVIGRMLADAHVLTWIGDPEKEAPDLEPLLNYIPQADAMHAVHRFVKPRCEQRAACARFLEDQAIMFFVGHEIAHISRGHVDYLLRQRGLPQSSERSDDQLRDDQLILERQCLEQDADRRSIMARVDSLRTTHQRPDYSGLPWAGGDTSAGSLIRDWSVSMSVLFRLFGDIRFIGVQTSRSNHPPLALRRLYAEATATWAVMNNWDAELRLETIDALNKARDDTEEAFATILGEPMQMDGFLDAMSPEGQNYAMRLHEHWNTTLVDKLRPYSYEF